MYVNQIDNIIDQTLDKLYLQGISKDPTFKTIVNGKKIDFVEYRDKINNFIQKFIEEIDVEPIYKLIQNRENIIRILDIIKRYVAYYYFLSLAYYYSGTRKDFRNNLIQYSKLQETSTFVIKNFFDTANNYQVITFFKIIKDVANIITMTELQRRALNPTEIKDAINFLKTLDTDYINNYLLMVVKDKSGADNVEINVHNLIKTIVFGEIYKNQERNLVFEILNEAQETQNEYTYIDIVVANDEVTDYDSYRQIFIGEENMDTLARDLYELVNETLKISTPLEPEAKNNHLLQYKIISPIVDDFLRYHRDSERLDVEADKSFTMPLVSNNNAKNVQLALLYQQRKKKENTKAQLIVNKIDAISDLYSVNVNNNPALLKDIKNYFQNPLSYRKAVMINYLDEVHVMKKIRDQGKRAIENNEYYLELVEANRKAYFNFKDFQKYGVSLNLDAETPVNMLRYTNIENNKHLQHLQIDMHTGVSEQNVNIVGLTIGPLGRKNVQPPIQCTRKENLLDIRSIKFSYYSANGDVVTKSWENGYDAFLSLFKHYYIDTIRIAADPKIRIYHDYSEIMKLNPELTDKVIYWIYDTEKDEYEVSSYENIRTDSFQEVIKYMNAEIYDKIEKYINKYLKKIIDANKDLSIKKIDDMVEIFSAMMKLFLKQEEKSEIIIRDYLQSLTLEKSKIYEPSEREMIKMPVFVENKEKSKIFRIKIDNINPLHPQEYRKLEAYTKEGQETIISRVESRCQHEIEWNEINKRSRTQDINIYNAGLTEFIEKFAIETTQLEFVCRVCGQILPLKQYVQDGSFDNNTQRFITAYVPLDVPLEDIPEYSKYKLVIRYLDSLINRVSLITGTNMLTGPAVAIRQKRKGLIKNIIDIIVKHNSVNMAKKISDEERGEFYAKKFNINKDLDSVFFFELDDNILNLTPSGTEINADVNRLKINNILLYFILIFITELNGVQITMMTAERLANIYVYLEYGPKLFGNLLIKTNINDMEAVPITRYPVLCYLIFLLSFFMIKYKLWYYPTATSNKFNPAVLRIIINSFVDIFNSVSIDAGKLQNDYIYMLTTNKLYSQMYTTFKNNDIINILKRNHEKFKKAPDQIATVVSNVEETVGKILPIKNPIVVILKPRKIPSFKVSSGIQYATMDRIIYPIIAKNTDLTNCPFGSFHFWAAKDKGIKCVLCGTVGDDANGEIDRTLETYYYNLNSIAAKRYIDGTRRNLEDLRDTFTMADRLELEDHIYKSESGSKIIVERLYNKFKNVVDKMYSSKELDDLDQNLNKLENENAKILFENKERIDQESKYEIDKQDEIYEQVVKKFTNDMGNKYYGQFDIVCDKLISEMAKYINADTNLDIDKYPVYLADNVYIIDHSYDGGLLAEPIIITQHDNRIIFRENHPFFKTDVYYYTDNRNQIDVFYHAITLRHLGYKEKHKDYVVIPRSNNYLKISASIKERLISIGYETKYINIADIFNNNSKIITDAISNYYLVLDGLIRDHIFKTKTIIDKIVSILSRVKNYQEPTKEETADGELKTAQEIDKLVEKYAKLIKNFNIGKNNNEFNDWNYLRNDVSYDKINWRETNLTIPENMYVNSENVNYYDKTSTIIMYYLVTGLIETLDFNLEKINKTNISQLYIEIISYIYNLYNMDKYRNSLEFKRFEYILNGSGIMIDLLRKGQGLQQSKEIEQQLDDVEPDIEADIPADKEELEDLREEAEALDVETDYYAEEEGDFVEGAGED